MTAAMNLHDLRLRGDATANNRKAAPGESAAFIAGP
jgi:hypothetical protein